MLELAGEAAPDARHEPAVVGQIARAVHVVADLVRHDLERVRLEVRLVELARGEHDDVVGEADLRERVGQPFPGLVLHRQAPARGRQPRQLAPRRERLAPARVPRVPERFERAGHRPYPEWARTVDPVRDGTCRDEGAIRRGPARDLGQAGNLATVVAVADHSALLEHHRPAPGRRLEAGSGRPDREERGAEEVRMQLEESLAVGDEEDAIAEPDRRRRDELPAGPEAAEAPEVGDELDAERRLLAAHHVGRPCPRVHAESLDDPGHGGGVRRRLDLDRKRGQLRRQRRARVERSLARVREARAPRRDRAGRQPHVDVRGALGERRHRPHPVGRASAPARGEPRQRVERGRHDAPWIRAHHARTCFEQAAPRRLDQGHARPGTEDPRRHELERGVEERADDGVDDRGIAGMRGPHDAVEAAKRRHHRGAIAGARELRPRGARVVDLPSLASASASGPETGAAATSSTATNAGSSCTAGAST